MLQRHTPNMQNEQKDRGGNSGNVRIFSPSRHGKAIAGLGAIPERNYFVLLRHGRTRNNMRRKMLRMSEQKDRAIKQSLSSLSV